ncbi:MAG: D-isomer specific 2-hydroxyacid dehydrogenase family protein [Clostridium sp.]|nr:D-isomer specific 2-hydroxyacid dehydrogenase family protein [Clostridium sp.]
MKILAYSHRNDETEYFKKFSDKYNIEVVLTEDEPSMETADLAKGFDCISIITTNIPEDLLKKFKDNGVKFISTRTIGYDHIDIKSAKEIGMHVGNVNYSTDSVADYTVMMMLMATRKIKLIMEKSRMQDFSLGQVQGKELHNLTVGVIGTGKIGRTVIKHLRGFECNILAYDIYENDEVKNLKSLNEDVEIKYTDFEDLIRNSDIITMHMPATEDNYHMINKETISKMRDGVFIINTARGSLINTEDFIEALENKKIGGAALDVIEKEAGLYYNDLTGVILDNKELAVLKSFPNVIVTPHTAFYTDQAVSDMVENSIKSCIAFMKNEENPWKVI